MTIKKFILLIVISTLSVYFTSCGGTRKEESLFDEPQQEEEVQQKSQQDEMSELEALLGIKREPKKKEKNPSEKAQELGLLGADEGKGMAKKGGQNTTTTEPVGDVRLAKLQKENEELRRSIRQKNQRIRELESELDALKQELAAAQEKATSQAGYNGASAAYPTGGVAYSATTYDITEYQSKYQEALNYFNQRNYEAALNIFSNLLKTDTNNDLADNVQYWIGECHYMMGKYKVALTDFEKVFTFPKSNKNDYALFKIALCYLRLGDRERARDELQRFLDEYPDSPLRNRASDLLNKL